MELIQLNIRGISHNQVQAGAYALLLEEKSGQIKIPIIIGILEAQSIASALEKEQHVRPFTHDLFVNFAKIFDLNMKSVIIYKIYDGIFFSRIIFEKLCDKGEKIEKEIDSRTSDAIALAIRFKSPIYATKEVFDKAGIRFEHYFSFSGGLDKEMNNIQNDLKKLTVEDLQNLLKQAVINEEYEFAAHIKKELDNRKNI
ncbi:MAG: bifunctional nuclease family protein [Candidatus Bostrichicola ureolyticus]|nr:MAG: bifunctional nuclease family protein [Candidatus Bostrichicola ureolyticus]